MREGSLALADERLGVLQKPAHSDCIIPKRAAEVEAIPAQGVIVESVCSFMLCACGFFTILVKLWSVKMANDYATPAHGGPALTDTSCVHPRLILVPSTGNRYFTGHYVCAM